MEETGSKLVEAQFAPLITAYSRRAGRLRREFLLTRQRSLTLRTVLSQNFSLGRGNPTRSNHAFIAEVCVAPSLIRTAREFSRASMAMSSYRCACQVPELDALSDSRILVALGVPVRFAHMLLFACPDCYSPIVASLLTATRNLEDVDDHYFLLQCDQCHGAFSLPAFTAKRHYAEEWDSQVNSSAKLPTATCQLVLFDDQADSE